MQLKTFAMLSIRAAEKKYPSCNVIIAEKLNNFLSMCDEIEHIMDLYGGGKVAFDVRESDHHIITSMDVMYCEVQNDLVQSFISLFQNSADVTVQSENDVVTITFDFPGIWKE